MSQIIELKDVGFAYPDTDKQVFSGLNLTLDRKGTTALTGQNGTGKSTLLLLAGGRIPPESGQVLIGDRDFTSLEKEEERNRLVSFVYQNMEFETDEPCGMLLDYILETGGIPSDKEKLKQETIDYLELTPILGKKLQECSKGEMQRVILAMSLFYGSEVIMMDEPVFALENRQKEKALELIGKFSQRYDIPVFYSLHEIELSQKYADNALLFNKNGTIIYGSKAEVLSDANIEEAYQVPMEMLYQKEDLYRKLLETPPTPEDVSGTVKVIE